MVKRSSPLRPERSKTLGTSPGMRESDEKRSRESKNKIDDVAASGGDTWQLLIGLRVLTWSQRRPSTWHVAADVSRLTGRCWARVARGREWTHSPILWWRVRARVEVKRASEKSSGILSLQGIQWYAQKWFWMCFEK